MRKNNSQRLGIKGRLAWDWALGIKGKGSGELRITPCPVLYLDRAFAYVFERDENRPGQFAFASKLLPALRRRSSDYARAGIKDPGQQALAELARDLMSAKESGPLAS